MVNALMNAATIENIGVIIVCSGMILILVLILRDSYKLYQEEKAWTKRFLETRDQCASHHNFEVKKKDGKEKRKETESDNDQRKVDTERKR